MSNRKNSATMRWTVLLALKEKARDLIVLHYYTDHTLKEMAEMMGMSYINAKVVHKKALESLRAFFAAR